MAAVTIARQRFAIFGDRRVKFFQVNINATGDQLTTAQLQAFRNIDMAIADAAGTVVVNTSFTAGGGGPITFNYSGGGSQNTVDVLVIGK